MWKCKNCDNTYSRRYDLLKHYKLDHLHYGRGHAYPCTYENCPCTCKTWKALLTHLSKSHPAQKSLQKDSFLLFKCHICDNNQLPNETDYFRHIGQHLKNHETVTCMFAGCSYKTNVYGAFNTHKWRKHTPYTIRDLKRGVVDRPVDNIADNPLVESFETSEQLCNDLPSDELPEEDLADLNNVFELKLASVLLKVENVFLVPSVAVNELLEELQYLIGTVSVPVTQKTVFHFLQDHNFQIDESVVKELATVLCTSNPIQAAIGNQGPLSSAWKRKVYYRKHFSVVQPVEFVLDHQNRRSFQYVPLLKSLQQLLNCDTILNEAINLKEKYQPGLSEKQVYRSFWDGQHCKRNVILSDDCSVSLILYVDDFEICNPLGTSRKKHKICALYWILGNLPPACHSSLSSINLAALINSNDVKVYGYDTVLEPLINDLITLEQHGIFVEKLGKTLKGTVQCVVADNLGAHAIAGFVESFSGRYSCRFCTAERSDRSDLGAGGFTLRTEDVHKIHLKTAEENSLSNYYGVKRKCALSEKLTHFYVTSGFPPDIVHDLFEGIVPVEIALCLNVFISKKYFNLATLNKAIEDFPYKWSDLTNRPHPVPLTYASRKTIGGNAHENWALLRFYPLLVGQQVPPDEPAWQLLGDLKDIVDLVVSPVQTEESIAYLNFKISEHRVRFVEVFPESGFLPKHHFVEHYPQLICQFGPLVALWTMRFEAKHSFFKRVVRHTTCFKNVLLSLAERHQFLMAHHFYMCSSPKSPLEVTNVSTLPIDILNEDIALAIKRKYPDLNCVNLTKSAAYNGLTYRTGMILAHGSLAGLPEFTEIIQMIVVKDMVLFIVKKLSAWYREHYRAYELKSCPTKEVVLLELNELADPYPLADYSIGGMRLITLKRHIHV